MPCGDRPRGEDPRGKQRRSAARSACASAPRESPRDEGDGPTQEDRHLSTFTNTKQMQSRLSERHRRPSHTRSVRFAERERRQSEPVTGGRTGTQALEGMRTESQLPVVLIGQIEATKQALDTLIQQDLRRHRKKSGALVTSVDRMMELMRDFEKLCTDEVKWRLLVLEVERCIQRVRRLITEFQKQSFLQRATNCCANTNSFDSLTAEIGQTIRTLKLSLTGTMGAGYAAATLRYSEMAHSERDTIRAAAVRQIPAMNGKFVGRDDLMRRLMNALQTSTDNRKICVLSGLRGSGKTAIATELASRLATEYPDSHFFADLLPRKDIALGGVGMDSVSRLSGAIERSIDAEDGSSIRMRSDSNLRRDLSEGNFQSLNVRETMRMVIRARTGSAAVLDLASTTELQSLYHECFANKHNILVLENAIDAQQVQALLPHNGSCLVIVTSMRHMAVPGVTVAEQIEPLSDVDAHAMLKNIDARLQQSDLEDLSSLCGNLPLALQVVGGALLLNPDIAPSKMARKLRKGNSAGGQARQGQGGVLPSPHHRDDGQHQHHSVYGIGPSGELARTLYGTLSVSYEFLSAGPRGSRETLQQLSVFADTFDLSAAEAVLNMESDEVEEHVSELLVNNMLEKAAALGGRAEGHYRYRMRPVVREFAISMRGKSSGQQTQHGQGQGPSGQGQIRTKLYEERFMNYYFEKIIQANVVARHRNDIGQRIWDADRGNFLKAIQMARSIPIREFELGYKGRSILKLCYPPQARIALYSRCVKMAEPLNSNDTLLPMLVELAQAYHDYGDDANAVTCFERVKAGVHLEGQAIVSASAVGLEKNRVTAAPPSMHANVDRASLRASTGGLTPRAMLSPPSMRDDKSERQSIFQSHSKVEDEEALLHLEQLLTASRAGSTDGPDDCSDEQGRVQHGQAHARTAVAPTISTLKARLRRNTLTRASSVEPFTLEKLLHSHDIRCDTNGGSFNGDTVNTHRRVSHRRPRLTSATANFASSTSSTALQWPGADNSEPDEPFVDSIEAWPRTRPARSSSAGQMEGVIRQRASLDSASLVPTLATVPGSPQFASASSSASTPVARRTGSSSEGGDTTTCLEATSVGEVTLVLDPDSEEPPPFDLRQDALEPSQSQGSEPAIPSTPPPPSPKVLHPTQDGVQHRGDANTSHSPPAGAFVDSPILHIATRSVLFQDASSSGRTGRHSSSDSIVMAATSDSQAKVSGVDALPAAYTDGGASMELAGRQRAIRRDLLTDLEPETEPETETVVEGRIHLFPSVECKQGRSALPPQLKAISSLYIPYAEIEWAGGEKSRARVASGAMGEVYAAERHGAEVAVKEIKEFVQLGHDHDGNAHESGTDDEVLREFCKEVQLLQSCRNQNVVLFIGYCFEQVGPADSSTYRLAVVTEYMARGSLWDNLHRRRVELRYSRRLRMLLDVVKGMQYLRHMQIVHCDLKTPNLLVDRNFLIKVADFGLARLHKDSLVAQVRVNAASHQCKRSDASLCSPALCALCGLVCVALFCASSCGVCVVGGWGMGGVGAHTAER